MAKGKRVRNVFGDVALGALGLAVGASLFFLFQATVGAASEEGVEPVLVLEAPAAGPGASSPQQAIEVFLDAQVREDASAAFDLLSAADRSRYASASMWAARRPLGTVQSWTWTDADALVAAVATEPGLSVTQGWSPAETVITWGVVDEDGWRVSLADTSSAGTFIDTSTAVDAAAAWLNDPARCEGASDPAVSLATPSSAFDDLCSTGGVLADITSSPVDGRVAAELELAYGGGASTWARSVLLEDGHQLTLAAVGNNWLVIDAVSP